MVVAAAPSSMASAAVHVQYQAPWWRKGLLALSGRLDRDGLRRLPAGGPYAGEPRAARRARGRAAGLAQAVRQAGAARHEHPRRRAEDHQARDQGAAVPLRVARRGGVAGRRRHRQDLRQPHVAGALPRPGRRPRPRRRRQGLRVDRRAPPPRAPSPRRPPTRRPPINAPLSRADLRRAAVGPRGRHHEGAGGREEGGPRLCCGGEGDRGLRAGGHARGGGGTAEPCGRDRQDRAPGGQEAERLLPCVVPGGDGGGAAGGQAGGAARWQGGERGGAAL